MRQDVAVNVIDLLDFASAFDDLAIAERRKRFFASYPLAIDRYRSPPLLVPKAIRPASRLIYSINPGLAQKFT